MLPVEGGVQQWQAARTHGRGGLRGIIQYPLTLRGTHNNIPEFDPIRHGFIMRADATAAVHARDLVVMWKSRPHTQTNFSLSLSVFLSVCCEKRYHPHLADRTSQPQCDERYEWNFRLDAPPAGGSAPGQSFLPPFEHPSAGAGSGWGNNDNNTPAPPPQHQQQHQHQHQQQPRELPWLQGHSFHARQGAYVSLKESLDNSQDVSTITTRVQREPDGRNRKKKTYDLKHRRVCCPYSPGLYIDSRLLSYGAVRRLFYLPADPTW